MTEALPLFGLPYEHSTCRDIGVVARKYPDVSFIVYHSGYESDQREGPYDPGNVKGGVDTLIKSLQDNEISPNSNVYAELGTTWAQPIQATHRGICTGVIASVRGGKTTARVH